MLSVTLMSSALGRKTDVFAIHPVTQWHPSPTILVAIGLARAAQCGEGSVGLLALALSPALFSCLAELLAVFLGTGCFP